MAINLKLLVAEIVFLFLVMALALFLTAGSLAWLAGWVFLILFFGFVISLTYWLLRHNPGLLKERMAVSSSNQKSWDKVFFALMNVVFLVWLVLMPLDAARFRWSQMPFWLQVVGALGLLGSFFLFFVTFRENSYLSPMVRIQEERGHAVVSSGPYHYVRHPMYAGALLFLLGTTLLMGSWFGLLAALALIILMAWRAVQEEHTLREELQGYDTYMTHVRYRFIPYIW